MMHPGGKGKGILYKLELAKHPPRIQPQYDGLTHSSIGRSESCGDKIAVLIELVAAM